jgi:hypothetical protein
LEAQGLPPVVRSADSLGLERAVAALPRDQRRPSTTFERFAWGGIAGMLAVIATDAAYKDGTPAAAATASYGVGTVLGVGLVTQAREGMNARGILVGAAAGTALGVSLLAVTGAYGNTGEWPTWGQLVAGIVYLVGVPLGASIGQVAF